MSYLNPSKAERRRHFLIVGGASVVITGVVMFAFLIENRSGYMKPDPKLIYAESWPEDRSRDDAIADRVATEKAREAKLAEARAYIATLEGEARAAAQAQYDAYVAGGAIRKDVPYVPAEPPVM
ncbi:MAG: hypothetical protein ACMVO5_09275 [Polymorphobacter sp.]|uniref:hypothetical protein n=1 Tax=Polymorphobacter sp. TaxID=1909290 RepID=UPI003A8B2CAC